MFVGHLDRYQNDKYPGTDWSTVPKCLQSQSHHLEISIIFETENPI